MIVFFTKLVCLPRGALHTFEQCVQAGIDNIGPDVELVANSLGTGVSSSRLGCTFSFRAETVSLSLCSDKTLSLTFSIFSHCRRRSIEGVFAALNFVATTIDDFAVVLLRLRSKARRCVLPCVICSVERKTASFS